MSAYVFNAMDRNIVSIIGQAIKVDLKLTDAELGLLGGTAFAALYAFGGIPVARLAERFNRVNILTLSLALWSGLTALAGLAGSFAQLLCIRLGVGVAESGCSPPAYSLISDYFEPRRRASAFSIYTCAISIGYLLAAVAGGYTVQRMGWRAACVLVGLPGIAMAILIRALVREPPRGHSDAPTDIATTAPPPSFSLRGEWSELSAVGRALLLDPPIRNMVLGVTISGFASYGLYAFVPPYFTRAFGLDYATVGVIAGLTGGVAVGIGIALGGFLADFLAARGARWYALVPGVGVALSAPVYVIALLAPEWRTAAVALGVAGFFQYVSLGPTFGVVQNAVPARRRATAAAFLYICLSVIALGGGPLFVGWTIDRFAEHEFRDASARSYALACPGGHAAPGVALANRTCEATLNVATRRGILLVVLLYGWAAVHYFRAGSGMDARVRASSVQSAST
jgi:MFS family permease